MSDMRTPILQFGTSRFLQAHADLFCSEAEMPRLVTVVQSSGDASRTHRLAALADPLGFPVRIRGLQNGETVDEETRVTSVRRTLSTATNWDEVERVFCREAEIVISNTGDAGFEPRPSDGDTAPSQEMSFPAKLFHLLSARFSAGGDPLVIMPTELISRNGDVLKARVLEVGRSVNADEKILDWIAGLAFANSLVDRIVSEPIEPAGAVAEPYALWAIEEADGVVAPCDHPDVKMVPDLDETERLKLYVLNLGHTVLVDIWQTQNLAGDALVRQMMDSPLREILDTIYRDEVLPGFALRGYGDASRTYLQTTVERFRNPFLDHRLSDIAQNHAQKAQRRIGAFMGWVEPTGLKMPELKKVLARAQY